MWKGMASSPVTACSFSPSGQAVAVTVDLPRYGPTQLLVLSDALEPLLDQGLQQDNMRYVAWSPCSTVLAGVDQEGKLQAVTLPGATSSASKTPLQQVAALQAQTAGLRIWHVHWSLGGPCWVSTQNGNQDVSLHMQRACGSPVLFGQAGAAWGVVLCVNPNGSRVLFAAKDQKARVGIWLLDSPAGGQSLVTCMYPQESHPCRLAWHPCEQHFCLSHLHRRPGVQACWAATPHHQAAK